MKYLTILAVLGLVACGDSGPDDANQDPRDAGEDAASDDVPDAAQPDAADTRNDMDDADPDLARPDATPDIGDDGARADASPDAPDADLADAPDTPDTDGDAGVEETQCPEGDVPDVRFDGDGRYRVLADLTLRGVAARTITVYLPPGYDGAQERYPVLYMHDGQNLFDPRRAAFGVEWGVDETLDALVAAGEIRTWIVVGIDNSGAGRIDDYTATRDEDRRAGGSADAYVDAVANEIKPIIDAHFRTMCGRNNTAVAGSSLGGIVSLHAGVRHGDIFGRIAAVSPSLWWNNRAPIRQFADSATQPLRLWLDAGSEESSREGTLTNDLTRNVREVAALARARGLRDGRALGTLEDQGAAHNEASWSRRLPAILLFLLGSDNFNDRDPAGLRLWAWDARVAEVGGRVALTVEAQFTGGGRLTLPPSEISWTTESPDVVTVEDGELVGHAVGTATIRATWREQTAELTIQVGTPLATLRFEVTVPVQTPDDAIVHLTGSVDGLGPWDPAGLPLRGDGLWVGELQLPVGTELEFKATRGSWETVEKDRQGDEIDNRRWRVDGDETVAFTVARWADQ